MTPDHHDLVLAITSHLPHLIAYTIVGTADELGQVTSSEVMKFSAGGFRDFTRIAASDPIMWRDVFLANKDAVLEMLGTFNEDLSKLTRAIRRGDGEALFEHFTRTRAIRRGIVEIGQDSAAPDFGRPHANLAKQGGLRTILKQRRDLRHFQRAQKHRAVDKAQRKRPRLLALQHRFLAERIDAGGDADIGVLLHRLAETGDRAVERAEQIVDVLRLDAGRDAIERRLRHALIEHLLDAERRNHLLDAGDRHLQFAVETALGIEAERAGGDRDQIALLNPRLHDLDMAAGGLDFAKPLRPRLWREILQAASACVRTSASNGCASSGCTSCTLPPAICSTVSITG